MQSGMAAGPDHIQVPFSDEEFQGEVAVTQEKTKEILNLAIWDGACLHIMSCLFAY